MSLLRKKLTEWFGGSPSHVPVTTLQGDVETPDEAAAELLHL